MKKRNVFTVLLSALVVGLMTVDVWLRAGGRLTGEGVLNLVVWSCAIGGLSCVLGRLSRIAFHCLMNYVLFFEVAGLYIWSAFHMSLGGDWLLIVANTNRREVAKFVQSLDWSAALWAMGAVMAFVALNWIAHGARFPRTGWRTCLFGCLLIVPFVCLNVLVQNWRDGLFSMSFTHVIRSTKRSHDSFAGLLRAVNDPQLPEHLTLESRTGCPPLGVFLIGESSTRNHWGLYGYRERDTTPCLNSVSNELCVFTDVVGCWSETTEACRYLLTDTLIEDESKATCTLPEVFRRAGYHCAYYTMTPKAESGLYDVLGACFSSCHVRNHLNEADGGEMKLDTALLPCLDYELRTHRDDPAVVFLQFSACHYPYAAYYPPDENVFDAKDGDVVKQYDNAVRYGDRVLVEVLERLKKEDRPVFVVYISDHGETPNSKKWRYVPDRDLWELPMFLWFSPAYSSAYPEIVANARAAVGKPLQADQLFYGFTRIALVGGCPQYSPSVDFLSAEFRIREKRMVLKKRFAYRKDGGRELSR